MVEVAARQGCPEHVVDRGNARHQRCILGGEGGGCRRQSAARAVVDLHPSGGRLSVVGFARDADGEVIEAVAVEVAHREGETEAIADLGRLDRRRVELAEHVGRQTASEAAAGNAVADDDRPTIRGRVGDWTVAVGDPRRQVVGAVTVEVAGGERVGEHVVFLWIESRHVLVAKTLRAQRREPDRRRLGTGSPRPQESEGNPGDEAKPRGSGGHGAPPHPCRA
ncbi:MAG TPA: hypothetical protein VGV61_19790, partial [Thermoanaerobaculia bacterium]|nr:hypothetical protein [Thermoanaerobaculia bacterium]